MTILYVNYQYYAYRSVSVAHTRHEFNIHLELVYFVNVFNVILVFEIYKCGINVSFP